MKNVEFKAELRDRDLARTVAEYLGARHVGTLEQTDTYYRVASARLKRRETVGEETEWVLYRRPDQSGPKVSDFRVLSDEEALERFGTAPMPVWVTVKKKRDLYLLDNVRIHLDAVEGLGNFLEFEALVRPGQSEQTCRERVMRLREHFAPALGEPIAASYSDLMANQAGDA